MRETEARKRQPDPVLSVPRTNKCQKNPSLPFKKINSCLTRSHKKIFCILKCIQSGQPSKSDSTISKKNSFEFYIFFFNY